MIQLVVKKRIQRKKIRSSPESRKRLLLSMVLVVMLVYLVTILLVSVFKLSSPYRVDVVPYDFSVKEHLGVNVDSDIIHFGGGPPGVLLSRSVILEAEVDSRVTVFWDGPGIMSVSKNDFMLSKGENTSVMFYLTVPAGLELGNYSGNVTFSFFES